MRIELDDLLCERYPDLFFDRHASPFESGMHFGFTCGDGWFELIDSLCATISANVKAGTSPPVVVRQVKEKLGRLRFRFRGGNDEIRRLVQCAEDQSETMGGGTGTGAAPVVAEVAREMGILTIGVVTKPFSFEGGQRMKSAEKGIAELAKHVDSLIIIRNDKQMEVLGNDADVDDCFKAADDVLKNAIGCIADIITFPGLVGVDLEDVRTVMGEMGRAVMGSASATGIDRARNAAERAIASPLQEGINLCRAKGVLVNITAGKGNVKMKEINEVMNTVQGYAAEDAHIIFGAVYDERIADALRVTVVATGISPARGFSHRRSESWS